MKNRILIIAFLIVAAFVALSGCGGGGGGGGSATLTGRVVNGATDVPLQGVRVALGSSNTTTASDGRFTLSGVPLGSGVLSAQLTGFEVTTVAVDIVVGQNTLSDVQMAPVTGDPPAESPRTLQGTITLSDGSNPTGVTVTLLSGTTQFDQMTTGSDGKYFFWAPAGTYKVRAAKSGFTTVEQQVTISDLTKVVTLNLTLQQS